MTRSILGMLFIAMSAFASGCGSDDDSAPPTRTTQSADPAPESSLPPRPRAQPEGRPRVVALGDSLTAGLGLPPDAAYPALLQQRLDEAGLDLQVVNAGVSGDTSAGAVRRLDWALEGDVRVVIVALGGNDGLRGLPADELRRNLTEVIERSRARGAEVILAGMEAPPNFGQAYVVSFRRVYPELAKQYNLPLVPFLLSGVAGLETMNQRDGIHPTSEGARQVADNVWRVLKPVAERVARAAAGDGRSRQTP